MQVPRPDLDAVLSTLTPREREIVSLVAAGQPNKVIAIDLGISLRTAEAHRARIFAKLDARNAMQLACRLCAHGRSGASPLLNAIEPSVLHEPAAIYGAAAQEPHGPVDEPLAPLDPLSPPAPLAQHEPLTLPDPSHYGATSHDP